MVDDTRLQQYFYIMTVSDLVEQPRNKSDNNRLLTEREVCTVKYQTKIIKRHF
jgi:hypothetical protein